MSYFSDDRPPPDNLHHDLEEGRKERWKNQDFYDQGWEQDEKKHLYSCLTGCGCLSVAAAAITAGVLAAIHYLF